MTERRRWGTANVQAPAVHQHGGDDQPLLHLDRQWDQDKIGEKKNLGGLQKNHSYLSSLRGVNVQHVCDHKVMLAQDSTCSSWESALWVDYLNKMEYQQLEAQK
jgi:hypothetical protein